jgi:LysM repeat protein
MIGKASRWFAHSLAFAALLALLVSTLSPLTPVAAAGPGAPRAVPNEYGSNQGTTGNPPGCLTVKEAVTAGAGAPANLAEGWTIALSGPASAETQTDGSGVAKFFGLASGTYTVTEVVSDTFKALTSPVIQVQVKPSLTGDDCAAVEFKSEKAPTSCIDGMGLDDGGRPLAGWSIHAEPADGNGPYFVTLTGQDGAFYFPNLTVGKWTVREDVSPDWTAVTPAKLDVAVTQTGAERCLPVRFKNRPSGHCVAGYLTDAIANVGVPGVPVTATLQNSAGISTTQTDGRGYFRFTDLDTGKYEVMVGRQAGWAPVGPVAYSLTPTAQGQCSVLKYWVRSVVGPLVGPAVAPPPRATACRLQHTVRRGDTVGDLAYQYRVSSSALVRANHLGNANKIYTGQTLCIP